MKKDSYLEVYTWGYFDNTRRNLKAFTFPCTARFFAGKQQSAVKKGLQEN